MNPKFCMQCGAKLTDGHKFCMQCGARLAEPAAPVQEDVTPQVPAAAVSEPVAAAPQEMAAPPVPQEEAVPAQEPIEVPPPQEMTAPVQVEEAPAQEAAPPQEPVPSVQEETPPVILAAAPSDPQCAEEVVQEPADDAEAVFHAGRDYLFGDHGAPVDTRKALSCFEEAHAKGCGEAARWMAVTHILAAMELVHAAPSASETRVEAGAQDR